MVCVFDVPHGSSKREIAVLAGVLIRKDLPEGELTNLEG